MTITHAQKTENRKQKAKNCKAKSANQSHHQNKALELNEGETPAWSRAGVNFSNQALPKGVLTLT